VRWRYTKDLNAVAGRDAGWVARVTFVPATWLELLAAPTNSQCHVALYGVPGQEYEMQVSTNALDWLPLGTVLSTNRIVPFIDLTATNSVRFYRARATLQSSMLDLSNTTEAGFDLNWLGIGVLEAAPTPDGPWQEVGGVSPYYVSTRMAPTQFFRVKAGGE